MDNPIQSAIQESLPENVTPESLPVNADVTQEAPAEAPAQQVEQVKETPFHEHPRWIERQRELELLRQQNSQLMELVKVSKAPAPQPVTDEYANLTPEEREAWRRIEKLAEDKARKVISEVAPAYEQELTQTKEALAAIAYERFQAKYPDVSPGSQEEEAIAQLYKRGYSLDDAYKVVNYEKNAQKAAQQSKTQQVQKTQQKQAANLEQTTLPPKSGLPTKDRVSFRQELDAQLKAAGY